MNELKQKLNNLRNFFSCSVKLREDVPSRHSEDLKNAILNYDPEDPDPKLFELTSYKDEKNTKKSSIYKYIPSLISNLFSLVSVAFSKAFNYFRSNITFSFILFSIIKIIFSMYIFGLIFSNYPQVVRYIPLSSNNFTCLGRDFQENVSLSNRIGTCGTITISDDKTCSNNETNLSFDFNKLNVFEFVVKSSEFKEFDEKSFYLFKKDYVDNLLNGFGSDFDSHTLSTTEDTYNKFFSYFPNTATTILNKELIQTEPNKKHQSCNITLK